MIRADEAQLFIRPAWASVLLAPFLKAGSNLLFGAAALLFTVLLGGRPGLAAWPVIYMVLVMAARMSEAMAISADRVVTRRLFGLLRAELHLNNVLSVVVAPWGIGRLADVTVHGAGSALLLWGTDQSHRVRDLIEARAPHARHLIDE